MTTDKFLEEYTGQTTDELISLDSEYRVDSIVLAFEQAIDQKAYQHGDASLSPEEKIILAIEALEREVNNGGFDQFFFNSSKMFTPMMVNALTAIGSRAGAEIAQDAINALRLQGNLTEEAIDEVMDREDESRNEKLSQCDDRYYDEVGDLSDKLLDFIRVNREKINLK